MYVNLTEEVQLILIEKETIGGSLLKYAIIRRLLDDWNESSAFYAVSLVPQQDKCTSTAYAEFSVDRIGRKQMDNQSTYFLKWSVPVQLAPTTFAEISEKGHCAQIPASWLQNDTFDDFCTRVEVRISSNNDNGSFPSPPQSNAYTYIAAESDNMAPSQQHQVDRLKREIKLLITACVIMACMIMYMYFTKMEPTLVVVPDVNFKPPDQYFGHRGFYYRNVRQVSNEYAPDLNNYYHELEKRLENAKKNTHSEQNDDKPGFGKNFTNSLWFIGNVLFFILAIICACIFGLFKIVYEGYILYLLCFILLVWLTFRLSIMLN